MRNAMVNVLIGILSLLMLTTAGFSQKSGAEIEKKVKNIIESLSSKDQLFIELYYYKELKPEEIANILKISVNTVYSIKSRLINHIHLLQG